VPSGAEQHPDDWWEGTVASIRAVLEQGEVDASSIAAVSVSAQAPCATLVDEAGRPTHPSLLWMDRRSDQQCNDRAGSDDDVRRVTGNAIDPYYAAPKVAWLLENEPGLRNRTSTLLMTNGYVNFKLTGRRSIDTGHAGLTLLADLEHVQWRPELAELWGIPLEWLPEIGSPTKVLGEVTAEAAAATGLRPGTPVCHGLVDGAAASLEGGIAVPGDVCEMTGQSTVLMAGATYDELAGGIGTLSAFPYPIPGMYLVFGSMVSTGGILRWFRDEFGDREIQAGALLDKDAFTLLDELAGSAPLGSSGVILLPYFMGERSPIWDTEARGVYVGLSMGTRRAEMVRAILEGTSYGLRHNLEEMAGLGIEPPTIRSVGGGSLGATWNQIKADVCALPLEVPTETIGAPVGDALVAAVAAGLTDDLATAVRERYTAGKRVEPDERRHQQYEPYYALYKDLYPALKPAFDRLAGIRRTREVTATV
jgi:xylulokinase